MFGLIQFVVTMVIFVMALLPTILYFKTQQKKLGEKYRITKNDSDRERFDKEKARKIEVRHTFFICIVLWVIIESIIAFAIQMILSIPGLANIGTFIVIPLVAAGFYFELQYFIKAYKKIVNSVTVQDEGNERVHVNTTRNNDNTSLRDKMKNNK